MDGANMPLAHQQKLRRSRHANQPPPPPSTLMTSRLTTRRDNHNDHYDVDLPSSTTTTTNPAVAFHQPCCPGTSFPNPTTYLAARPLPKPAETTTSSAATATARDNANPNNDTTASFDDQLLRPMKMPMPRSRAPPGSAAAAAATMTTANHTLFFFPSYTYNSSASASASSSGIMQLPVARVLRRRHCRSTLPRARSSGGGRGGSEDDDRDVAYGWWDGVDERSGGGGGDGGSLSPHLGPIGSMIMREERLRKRGGRVQSVEYTDGGSPTLGVAWEEDSGSEECLVREEEGAAVYGEVWRRRERNTGGLWVMEPCPEWEGVRAGMTAAREADDGDGGGGGRAELERRLERWREWEKRRQAKRKTGYTWEEWDWLQMHERAGGPYWIAEDDVDAVSEGDGGGVRWMEGTILPDRRLDGEESSPKSARRQHTAFEYEDIELGNEEKACEDEQIATQHASYLRKTRIVSENWETHSRTPSVEASPHERRARHTHRGPSPASVPFRSYGEQATRNFLPAFRPSNGAVPQVSVSLPYINITNPTTRPRRLTTDPIPNRLAAARRSNKHFRKMGSNNQDGAAAVSPTLQTMQAAELPLSDGFQINLISKRELDPFTEPAAPQVVIDGKMADSMEEIDGLLTRIWHLYANGDEHNRMLLLHELRLTIAMQEALLSQC